jgi:cytochrome c553
MRQDVLLLSVMLIVPACGGNVTHKPAKPAKVKVTVDDQVRLGGTLYDKWWKTAGLDKPTGDHPLWATRPDTATNKRNGATTWRCKECHGWDYKGVEGAYAKGSHRTGFPGIWKASQKSEATLFSSLKHTHGYEKAGLSDRHIRALVAFIKMGLLDTSLLVGSDGTFRAEGKAGAVLFNKRVAGNMACASCHGQDGLKSPTGKPGFDDFPGKVAVKNPWELIHKLRFGQPGTYMPKLHGKISNADLGILGAYCQGLPQKASQ